MKRLTALLSVLALAFVCTACGIAETVKTQTDANPPTPDATAAQASAQTEAEETPQKAVLVTGWNFDASTGTLTINEPKYGTNVPNAAIADDVRTLEITGSITRIPYQADQRIDLTVYPNLKKIVVGDSVTALDDAAFDGCFQTEEIVLGSGVQTIADNAFFGSEVEAGCSGCVALQKISVRANNPYFTAQGDVLYNKDRTKLILYPMHRQQTEYIMPDSVKSVNWYAFSMNQTLQKLTVGKGIRTLDFSLIMCDALHTLILPNTLTAIGDSAVKYCGLRSVRIPDSVTTLGAEAFAHCAHLEMIHIGKGVKPSEDNGFMFNSPVLKEITVDDANPSLCVEDGILFSKDRRTLLIYPGGRTQSSYSVPDGTQKIGWGAFADQSSLRSIYIPADVREIEPDNISFFVLTDTYEGVEYPYTIWFGGSRSQWNAATQGAGDTDGLTVYCNADGIG